MKKIHCVASAFSMIVLIVALTGCGSKRVALAPEDRDQLKNQSKIVAVHYQPRPYLPVKSLGGVYELAFGATGKEGLVDPLPRVKERFLQSVAQEFGLTNVRSVDQAYDGPRIAPTGTGLVFEFYTYAYQLVFVRRALSAGKTTYGLDYIVGASLIRKDDGRVLWEQACSITRDRNPRAWDELTENDNALVKNAILEAADACAAELVDFFAGRAEWSQWSGRKDVQPAEKKE